MNRKHEPRDIYQGANSDLDKDFSPQVASRLVEDRQRDLRRSHLVSILFGIVAILLSVALVSFVIRDFLGEEPADKTEPTVTETPTEELLSADETWIADYQYVETDDPAVSPGPEPLSAQSIKLAAAYIVEGQQELAANSADQALSSFQKVVDIFPDIEGIHRAIGMLYLQQEDFTNAAVHLEKALKEDKTFDVFTNLGAAYIGSKDYEKAERVLQEALKLQPENPICHINLAILYRKMDRANQAVYHFEKYIDLRPDDINTMQGYALYLTKLERWKEAETFLTALTKEVTDVAPLYFLLAQAHNQNGKQEAAVASLQRGVQLVDQQIALEWLNREEFNSIRKTDGFMNLVNQLTAATPTP
ncbi:MAG: tetratricopeptide repeat protein [Kiritimatiellales bacterium]